MKKVVVGSTQASLPESKYFKLVEETGRYTHTGTPWRFYRVRPMGLAEKHVVDIDLDDAGMERGSFSREASTEELTSEIRGMSIRWGNRMARNTDKDVYEMIEVLNDALTFENKLRRFFQI